LLILSNPLEIMMKSIRQLKNIRGKRVLVRVDFNVPIRGGKILDTFRIEKALLTINYLRKKGARIILISHLEAESGKSLKPVARYLSKASLPRASEASLRGKLSKSSEIQFVSKVWGKEVDEAINKMRAGEVILLENLRQEKGEEKNDMKFAKKLARLGDIYVNDAFPVSHRKHASVVSLPKLLPAYAGFQLEEEVKNLEAALKNPPHPFLFILGGAKFETKLPLIKKYLKLADNVFIGGALLNDFLKAKGYEVGKSLVYDTKGIKKILNNRKLILPDDVIVKSVNKLINKKANEVKKDEIILDIGNDSVKMIEPLIQKSKLILWNGPLGKYENGGDKATKKILNILLKERSKMIILGGGDLVDVLSNLKPKSPARNASRSDAGGYKLKPNLFVSTGGGAMLEFLAKGTLPGIKALG
jgi:phosphoglycerate kinase